MNTNGIRMAAAAAAGLCLALAAQVAAETTGNVTWTGVGATPGWDVAGNWDPDAPVTNTPGRVTFSTAGQAVTSVVETNRSVNELFAGHTDTTVGCTHTIDLGGNVLTVTNRLRSIAGFQGRRNTLNIQNGTLRVGTAATPAQLDVFAVGTLKFMAGVKLDPINLDTIAMGANAHGTTYLDLQGAEVVGGSLKMRRLLMPCNGWFGSQILLDGATQISSIRVRETFELARGNVNNNTPQYIGNPSDTFTMDGFTFGKLPPGINLEFGVSETQRASVIIAEHSLDQFRCVAAIRASGGGVFTGYLSSLRIGVRNAAMGLRFPRGMLHLAEMDSCLLDAVTLEIAPGRAAATATDDERGELWLPPGTATIGTATLGANGGVGFGRLNLRETTFTVTNALALRKTGQITLNVGATSSGLDIEKGFSDEGGTIHVNFTAQPSAETNWAVRIKGDVAADLNLMIGQGRLTRAIDGAITGRKSAVVADNTYTYFALVDEALTFPPIAIAKNVTFEIGPNNLVLVHPSEVDDGSSDPEQPETPPQLRLIYNGGPETNVLEFASTGSYPVTLVVNRLDGEGNVEASATDEATITVAVPPAGTQDNVEWIGAAATVLMPDRPEWFWSGNWSGGVPPANPTSGTILYRTLGQSVKSLLETDREVYRLDAGQSGFTVAHTIDLGTQALTIGNRLGLVAGTTHLTLENGTVRLGGTTAANIWMRGHSTLTFGQGAKLRSDNLNEIDLNGNSWATTPVIDLRGAEVIGGTLSAGKLIMPATSWYGSRIYLDTNTLINTITVRQALDLGIGNVNETFQQYIGDPSNTFWMDGKTFGMLPAGIDLRLGVSTSEPASVTIAEQTAYVTATARTMAAVRVAEGGGGALTAYLSTLKIGTRTGTGLRRPRGMLHLAAMDSCMLDAETLIIATGRGIDTLATDNERGELHLPPGTATIGTATIGAPDGVGWGLLSLSNTVVTVTDALTLNKTAQVIIDVGDTASGLDLTSANPGALTLDPGVALTVRFHAPAAGSSLHYGLRLPGDHVVVLNAMPSLVIDSSGLSKPAQVFHYQGATYIGVPPPAGSLILLR